MGGMQFHYYTSETPTDPTYKDIEVVRMTDLIAITSTVVHNENHLLSQKTPHNFFLLSPVRPTINRAYSLH